MPPSIVPNESGIISFDGLIFVLREMLLRPGRRTAAEAMLFITSESIADAAIVTAINRASLFPATRNRYPPNHPATPVLDSPAVIMKIAAIVITAGFAKPANASGTSKALLSRSAETTSKATISGLNLSHIKRTTAAKRI
jgi:hypothetical protein